MNPELNGILSIAVAASLVLMTAACLITFLRLARGPSRADRVMALDLIGVLVLGIVTIYAIGMDQPVFLDVAIGIALISFLGTIAFARYLEKIKE